jgi:hypothetical protein
MGALVSRVSASPIVRFGAWFAAVLFVLVGLVCGVVSFQNFRRARETAGWPSVRGEILNVEVKLTGGYYYPTVSYAYTVGGRELIGDRIRVKDNGSDSYDIAEEGIEGLAQGNVVEVYFNPSDPAESVLQPGAGYQEHAMLVISVVTFVMGVAAILWVRRSGL